MIDSGMSGVISLPFYAEWTSVLKALPFAVQKLARWLSGIDRAMV